MALECLYRLSGGPFASGSGLELEVTLTVRDGSSVQVTGSRMISIPIETAENSIPAAIESAVQSSLLASDGINLAVNQIKAISVK